VSLSKVPLKFALFAYVIASQGSELNFYFLIFIQYSTI
jgi:uncharacterized membrane protein